MLNEEHQKLQMKFDAAKTRNKILTSELKGLKEQMKMLVDKGAHDDELIAALMVGLCEIKIASFPSQCCNSIRGSTEGVGSLTEMFSLNIPTGNLSQYITSVLV